MITLEDLKREISECAKEMNDFRNDGWLTEGYKTFLKEVKKIVDKALEK